MCISWQECQASFLGFFVFVFCILLSVSYQDALPKFFIINILLWIWHRMSFCPTTGHVSFDPLLTVLLNLHNSIYLVWRAWAFKVRHLQKGFPSVVSHLVCKSILYTGTCGRDHLSFLCGVPCCPVNWKGWDLHAAHCQQQWCWNFLGVEKLGPGAHAWQPCILSLECHFSSNIAQDVLLWSAAGGIWGWKDLHGRPFTDNEIPRGGNSQDLRICHVGRCAV